VGCPGCGRICAVAQSWGFLMGLFSSKSSSSSTNNNITTTTDNRAVAGDESILIGAGGIYNGTDAGAVEVAKFNGQLLQAISEHQTDGARALMNMGAGVLNNLAESVTDVTAKSGANMAQAWSHTLDTSGAIIESLTMGARANADAGQTLAMAAMQANQGDGATASQIFKYAAIAAAVIGGLWAISRKG
jgi:hypothetical protein